ncbi:uncharacterized protein Dana_GF24242 [Drosophila ananassae]|uniref:Folded gastrulation N-terminal domain-containing protein n=1 Tax=Drosophila ananassae TaxID=7217 RepID=B3M7X9_DROAN|nr:cell wall protein DAN4 [Drosophila ananassae]EDV39887.1 uncharacterized protein Dana_GF24242 [Drosophila ananassae]
MKCFLLTTVLATLTVASLAAPLQFSDILTAFQPAAKQDVVKRQVAGNPDAELKQISFHGLIGDLEDSLFQSALSLHQASAPGTEVEEVKPQPVASEEEEHSITKRSDESTPATDAASTDDGLARKILLQTTKKVPGEDGVPAHLIIDHVSVQPHNGGALPLIPTFQVHHTKLISATIKEDSNNDSSDGKQTKISITKTSITSTAPLESVEEAVALASKEETSSVVVPVKEESTTVAPTKVESTTVAPIKVESTTKAAGSSESSEEDKKSSSTTVLVSVSDSSSSTTASSITSTTTPSTTSTTTEEPIQKLKKDEEKLKEKVAEVEAEPVILSARV